jgi:hypothetical protein
MFVGASSRRCEENAERAAASTERLEGPAQAGSSSRGGAIVRGLAGVVEAVHHSLTTMNRQCRSPSSVTMPIPALDPARPESGETSDADGACTCT